jgi:phosphoenolpyruvate carboxylase
LTTSGGGRLPSFDSDAGLLTEALDEVIRLSDGATVIELRDRAVALARATREGDPDAPDVLAEMVSELDLDQIELLLRSLSRRFQLVNLAEDNERVRRVRRRAAREAPEPRRGSLRDAVSRLAGGGVTADELQALVNRSELRLVLTPHPTEARRRTTIEKLARVFRMLRELDERADVDTEDVLARLRASLQELWGSDELRAISLTVMDEVRGGLVYFARTLTEEVPRVYRELEQAIAEMYPDAGISVPPLLRFGSWIGGDRDGNPNVTPATTIETLDLMREQCLRFLERRVELLAGRLSLSDRVSGPAWGLAPILEAGAEYFPELAQQLEALNPEEPYRRALTFVRERVRATARYELPEGYGEPAELLADLRHVERSLLEQAGAITATGDLRDVIRQVEVFGFHYARLDIREHARVHRRSLSEIYAALGICQDYESLEEDERMTMLCRAIADRRPLIPADIEGFSAGTRETIETFRTVCAALSGTHRGAIETYIVSGTEGAADLLEVLLLMKEASLARAGGEEAALRIVPLFESGAALAGAPETMDRLLALPEYRSALRAVGDEQEVMIGYSDSNKDVGYVGSAWGAYRAQTELVEVFRRHQVSWVFFHGRGGALGRGGGPTSEAILALPLGTVEGRLKMTEQGEVLAAKYAVPEIAHRELELAASATLAHETLAHDPERLAAFERIVEEMAEISTERYQTLVHDDPDFPRFFAAATPVEEISRLRLGSRPAKRRAEGGIDELRAIPWVFSWTQSRIVLPAWLGLGTALAAARERHGLDVLQEMVADWTFFASLIANAEMACTKADTRIATRYTQLWDDEVARERIWGQLETELELTRAELMRVRGEERLLASEPVLQASIDRRNPYVDPISFVQIELLRRRRAQPDSEDGRLARASLLAINGIASGLRNTG